MIAALATGIGLEMGLPHEEIERIRIASLLHDLGKIAIPEEILDKPTTLSDDEWQAIGEHPRIGQVILEQASNLREAIPVVLHHHERFNGGGYPHGLQGNEIPLGARIVAVADAYHAMVHDRPYKGALTHDRGAGRASPPTPAPSSTRRWSRCSALSTTTAVPADGLQEVYRLHERARGGLAHIPAPTTTAASRRRLTTPRHGPPRRRRPACARGVGLMLTRLLLVLAIAAALRGAPSVGVRDRRRRHRRRQRASTAPLGIAIGGLAGLAAVDDRPGTSCSGHTPTRRGSPMSTRQPQALPATRSAIEEHVTAALHASNPAPRSLRLDG